jgi:CMP-N,N'-diacetyllegionaminic acid synthase
MNDVSDKIKPVKVLGIIPARGASKGVPRKNIAMLGGLPLIAHTIRAARDSALLDDIVVSTDDEEIANVARAHGLSVPWLRPPEMAGDRSRVQDAVHHALSRYPHAKEVDYLLLLQPTTPFRTGADIDEAIRLAIKHQADSVVSFVREESRHPYYMYYYASGDTWSPPSVKPFVRYEPGLPRQEFPPCVFRNGAIYLVKQSYFIIHNSFLSDDCIPYIMPPERSVNIDTPEDFLRAKFMLSQREEGTA